MVYIASQMPEKMLKFTKLGQQNPPKREVLQRKEDFKEIYNEFINKKQANSQADVHNVEFHFVKFIVL